MTAVIGYRFHPTDEELINHYLMNKFHGNENLVGNAINEINIYSFDPWDLPCQAKIQSDDQVWYFFCPRDNKYANRKRASRKTEKGYWKPTGRDRKIKVAGRSSEVIGIKKTLVFYQGRVPNGKSTAWVMHEYHSSVIPPNKRTYVVCKLKNKAEGKNPVTSCGEVEPSHPPPSNSESHAVIHTMIEPTPEVKIQTAGSPPESVCDFGGFDDDLGLQWKEQEDGIFPWDLLYPNEFGDDQNMLQSELDSTCQGLDLLNCPEFEFVNSSFAEHDDCSWETNTCTLLHDKPLESLTGMHPDTIADSWSNHGVSRSLYELPDVSSEHEQSLVQESASNLESFKSLSRPIFNNFAAKECPEESPFQGKLLQLGASRNKCSQETSRPIEYPTHSNNHEQLGEESVFNSKTRSSVYHSNFVTGQLEDLEMSISFSFPRHSDIGMSINSTTSRILIILLQLLMVMPVEMISYKDSKKNLPIPKIANLKFNQASSSLSHGSVPEETHFRVNFRDQKHHETRQKKSKNQVLLLIRPGKSLKRSVRKNRVSSQKQFKHIKPTQRCSKFIQAQSLLNHSPPMQYKEAVIFLPKARKNRKPNQLSGLFA